MLLGEERGEEVIVLEGEENCLLVTDRLYALDYVTNVLNGEASFLKIFWLHQSSVKYSKSFRGIISQVVGHKHF